MTGTTREDRAIGCLLGLAIGDAVGTTLEFVARDSRPPLTDMVGGGPFGLAAGQWTDDTAMALCLAHSLLHDPDLDEADLMRRFVGWWRRGENSVIGACFDIGITTRQALARFERTGDPRAGDTDERTAGNGSIMRLAPAVLCHHADRDRAIDVARRQGRTTHGAPAAIDGCALLAELLLDAIDGADARMLTRPRRFAGHPEIGAIATGQRLGSPRSEIRSSGYVVHTLEAALWCVARGRGFRDTVLLAANLGDDADTVAAVTGQIAGAIYGESGIPAAWRRGLAWHDRIRAAALALYARGAGPAAQAAVGT